jgi:hypothetical protein
MVASKYQSGEGAARYAAQRNVNIETTRQNLTSANKISTSESTDLDQLRLAVIQKQIELGNDGVISEADADEIQKMQNSYSTKVREYGESAIGTGETAATVDEDSRNFIDNQNQSLRGLRNQDTYRDNDDQAGKVNFTVANANDNLKKYAKNNFTDTVSQGYNVDDIYIPNKDGVQKGAGSDSTDNDPVDTTTNGFSERVQNSDKYKNEGVDAAKNGLPAGVNTSRSSLVDLKNDIESAMDGLEDGTPAHETLETQLATVNGHIAAVDTAAKTAGMVFNESTKNYSPKPAGEGGDKGAGGADNGFSERVKNSDKYKNDGVDAAKNGVTADVNTSRSSLVDLRNDIESAMDGLEDGTPAHETLETQLTTVEGHIDAVDAAAKTAGMVFNESTKNYSPKPAGEGGDKGGGGTTTPLDMDDYTSPNGEKLSTDSFKKYLSEATVIVEGDTQEKAQEKMDVLEKHVNDARAFRDELKLQPNSEDAVDDFEALYLTPIETAYNTEKQVFEEKFDVPVSTANFTAATKETKELESKVGTGEKYDEKAALNHFLNLSSNQSTQLSSDMRISDTTEGEAGAVMDVMSDARFEFAELTADNDFSEADYKKAMALLGEVDSALNAARSSGPTTSGAHSGDYRENAEKSAEYVEGQAILYKNMANASATTGTADLGKAAYLSAKYEAAMSMALNTESTDDAGENDALFLATKPGKQRDYDGFLSDKETPYLDKAKADLDNVVSEGGIDTYETDKSENIDLIYDNWHALNIKDNNIYEE